MHIFLLNLYLRKNTFMRLEKYISDLLYRYDLVIIPDFGAIIGRKKPARFDHGTYIFSPPHKDLSFNAQLKEHDGLLVNYISQIEGVSYDSALLLIKEQVNQWHQILQKEKRLKLDQIGIFNLIDEDRVIFLPLTTKNYLAEAYGLTSFVHKPLPLSANAKTPVSEISTVEKTKTAKPAISKRRLKKQQPPQKNYPLWKYAAVFVVGLGLFTAGIKLFQPKNTITEEPVFQKATFVLDKNFPTVNIIQPVDKSISSKNKESLHNYFIISGAFRNKDNAQTKLNQLKKAGYPAKIIGQNKHGLWMVAYQGFDSKEAAGVVLKEIKQLQRSAWIFEKK